MCSNVLCNNTESSLFVKYVTEICCVLNLIFYLFLTFNDILSGIHKVQEQGVGQGVHGDELHWTKVGSTAGVISGLSPGTEKAGEDL
jgi:hypothetical protein